MTMTEISTIMEKKKFDLYINELYYRSFDTLLLAKSYVLKLIGNMYFGSVDMKYCYMYSTHPEKPSDNFIMYKIHYPYGENTQLSETDIYGELVPFTEPYTEPYKKFRVNRKQNSSDDMELLEQFETLIHARQYVNSLLRTLRFDCIFNRNRKDTYCVCIDETVEPVQYIIEYPLRFKNYIDTDDDNIRYGINNSSYITDIVQNEN